MCVIVKDLSLSMSKMIFQTLPQELSFFFNILIFSFCPTLYPQIHGPVTLVNLLQLDPGRVHLSEKRCLAKVQRGSLWPHTARGRLDNLLSKPPDTWFFAEDYQQPTTQASVNIVTKGIEAAYLLLHLWIKSSEEFMNLHYLLAITQMPNDFYFTLCFNYL